MASSGSRRAIPTARSSPTGPFHKWASDRRAEVLLRQVDAARFVLSQPFRYVKGDHRFFVTEGDVTDLASVPTFFTWLVPRYGRHTLAALLHDHLQHDDRINSVVADAIFRDAMGDTGVPLARRWLMWAAVSLRTEVKFGGCARAARVIVWGLLFGLLALVLWPTAGLVVLIGWSWAAVRSAVAAVALATVAPLALSWVWGRRWRLGAIAGLALVYVTVQVALVLIALGIYAAVEWAIEHVLVRAPERNPVMTRNL